MNNKGFSLIEIILAIGLSVIFLPAIMIVFSVGLHTSKQGEEYTKAYALASEHMEAIYALKMAGDSAWDWTTTPMAGIYQPYKSAGKWLLGSTVSTPIKTDTIYTSTVTIANTQRCGTTPCDSGGVVDTKTRKITVLVTWPDNIAGVRLISYVTQH
jgi:type II secretory pathway pseudopilin PulG